MQREVKNQSYDTRENLDMQSPNAAAPATKTTIAVLAIGTK